MKLLERFGICKVGEIMGTETAEHHPRRLGTIRQAACCSISTAFSCELQYSYYAKNTAVMIHAQRKQTYPASEITSIT